MQCQILIETENSHHAGVHLEKMFTLSAFGESERKTRCVFIIRWNDRFIREVMIGCCPRMTVWIGAARGAKA